MSHAITIHDRTFPTIKAAAAHFNMPRETLSRKVNSGVSAEEAVDKHLARMQKKRDSRKKTITNKPIECAGRTFPSIAAFARAIKMPEPTVRGRLAKGESPSQIAQDAVLTAPSTPLRTHKRKRIDVKKGPRLLINGERFPNANQMAADYDMPTEIVEDRLKKGWSAAQAVGLTPPPDGRAPTLMPIDFNGREYDSLMALAEALSLDTASLCRHVDQGEDIVEAIEQLQRGADDEVKPQAAKKARRTENTLSLRSVKEKATSEPERASSDAAADSDDGQVTYDGETYRNENALAAAYGVPIATFLSRRSQGKSLSESLGEHTKRATAEFSRKRQPFVVFDKSYPSISAIARDFNIAAHRIRYCLQTNDDLEALLTRHQEEVDKKDDSPVDGKKRQPITFRGKEYATITDLANAYGIKPNTLASRLRKNKPLHEAMGLADVTAKDMPSPDTEKQNVSDVNKRPQDPHVDAVEAKQKQKVSYKVGGLTFYSVSALAEHFGVPAERVAYRMGEGASAAEAVGHLAWTGEVGQGKTLSVGEHTFPSIKAAAAHFGVNYPTLRRRLQEGMSPEKAVGAHLPESLQVGEHHFTSIPQFARHYRLDPDVTSRRLLAGWTTAEILGDALPPKERYAGA